MTGGRLTYTSFDALAGRSGGWQVKEEEALDQLDRTRALELVSTSLDLVEEPPRFPSEKEIAALPRRMAFDTSPTGARVLVHSVLAGPDASGRPGNVFSHVVVLKRLREALLADPPAARPILLWRSPDWIAPWGPDAVRSAAFEGRPLIPGARRCPTDRETPLMRPAVVSFLLDRVDRGPGLGALLDALEDALQDDGPPVALLVDDQEDGVLWLAAVALLLSPSASADLTFSTWERAHGLRDTRTMPRVTVVPAVDETLLPDAGLVVLAPERQLPCTPAGWPTVRRGQTVPPGDWSAVADGLTSLSPDDLADRLQAVDELAGLNPMAAAAHPLWPLSVAVAEWSLSGQQRAVELLLQVPLDLIDDEMTRADVSAFRSSVLGTSAASAVQALHRLAALPAPDLALLRELRVVWLHRVLEEGSFLEEAWPPVLPPVLERTGLATAEAAALSSVLSDVCAQDCTPVETATAVLRLLDLAARLGDGAGVPLDEVDTAGYAVMAARMLLGPDGAAVLAGAGPLTAPTAALLVAELDAHVAKKQAAPGDRLPEHLWKLVVEVVEVVAPVVPLPEDLWLEAVTIGLRDDLWKDDRAHAAHALLKHPRWEQGVSARDRACRTLEFLQNGRRWRADELLQLHRQLGDRADVDLQDAVRVALEGSPPGDDVATVLATALLEPPARRSGLEPLTYNLAQVHRAVTPALHRAGPGRRPDVVQVLVHGLAYITTRAASPATVELILPHLLVAATLNTAWEAAGVEPPVDVGNRHYLDELAPSLPTLARALLPASRLLTEALQADECAASGLFTAMVRAGLTDEPGSRKQPTAAERFLLTALTQEQRVKLGVARLEVTQLGDALLHLHLRSHPEAAVWLNRQVNQLTDLSPDDVSGVRAWAHGLHNRLASAWQARAEQQELSSTTSQRSTP